jgi:hypothetical protein
VSALPTVLVALEITDSEATEISHAHLALALRRLARLMITAHHAGGDPVANAAIRPKSSALTVSRGSRPHHGDEAA